MAAKGNKIPAWLGVVISLEANGSSVMDFGVVFHGIPVGAYGLRPFHYKGGRRPPLPQTKAARTRSGVNGISRRRIPVASKIALATAAAVVTVEGSPAPKAG